MTTVRPARPGDHDAIGRLTLDAYDAVGQVTAEYRATLDDVAGRLADGATVLVAVDGDDVLGSVTLVDGCSRHFEHAGHGDGGFRMLAVAPSAQGRGVGRALLDASLRHGRHEGWRRMTISTMTWMDTAHALYESVGFTRRPDLDVRYGSGVALAYELDLTDDAAAHFPAPGPVPDEPRVFVRHHVDDPPGC